MSCNFFQPIYEDSCGFTDDLRYLDTDRTKQEREIYAQYFIEQTDQFGIEVDYIVNNYALSAHDMMYGEHTTKTFDDPVKMIMYIIFNDDSIILNQFGIESQGDITAFIPISSYQAIFGECSEPKSGDLIKLSEYGSTNRPNGRNAEIFEITHRDDQNIQQTIPLMGHYAWMIWAKRYDYSYENNVDPEKVINQIDEGERQYKKGILVYDDKQVTYNGVPMISETGDKELSSVTKTYDNSADELGELIFDYDKDIKSDDSVYGDY
jgi:hypothetical protein